MTSTSDYYHDLADWYIDQRGGVNYSTFYDWAIETVIPPVYDYQLEEATPNICSLAIELALKGMCSDVFGCKTMAWMEEVGDVIIAELWELVEQANEFVEEAEFLAGTVEDGEQELEILDFALDYLRKEMEKGVVPFFPEETIREEFQAIEENEDKEEKQAEANNNEEREKEHKQTDDSEEEKKSQEITNDEENKK